GPLIAALPSLGVEVGGLSARGQRDGCRAERSQLVQISTTEVHHCSPCPRFSACPVDRSAVPVGPPVPAPPGPWGYEAEGTARRFLHLVNEVRVLWGHGSQSVKGPGVGARQQNGHARTRRSAGATLTAGSPRSAPQGLRRGGGGDSDR